MIWKRLRQALHSDSGVAMLFAMIVGVVVMVFCLSLLLVTYTLYAQTIRQTENLQCKSLAQSFAETLEPELTNPESELCNYLEKQILDGYWVPDQELPEAEEAKPEAVTELLLGMKQADELGDYKVTISLTYTCNVVEDDDEELEEDDDQDESRSETSKENNPENAGEGGNSSSGEEPNQSVGTGSFCVVAKVTCRRGDKEDSSVPVYVMEKKYENISFE